MSQQEERSKRFGLNLQQTRVEIGRLTTELEIFRNKRHLLESKNCEFVSLHVVKQAEVERLRCEFENSLRYRLDRKE